MNVTPIRRALVPGVAALALLLSACGDDGGDDDGNDGGNGAAAEVDTSIEGDVVADGSSTVYPMTVAAQELLTNLGSPIKVKVGESGTGGGFEVFCTGETDISDASRPIKDDEEAPICAENGVEYTELLVATDALTVVVHPDLAIDCLTVDELIALLKPGSTAKNWQDINPDFPDQAITGFIPGTDSGTYDYMASEVVDGDAEEPALRNDFESSEDDNVLVTGVAGTEGSVGFFGYTYYEENTDKVKALEIDGGAGCVGPSAETAQDGSYTPLARPLFIYVSNASYNDNPAVAQFVDFYIANLETIATGAQFIALNESDYAATQETLAGIGG